MEKIMECEIKKKKYENEVYVTYHNGITEKLFRYYPDELTFSSSEFLGLTKDEALRLYHKRDIEYLQN